MPGVRFAKTTAGQVGVPNTIQALLAGGSAGGVTISYGDFVVRTTKSTLTANAVPVVRTLLAADVTAVYQQGGSIVGILGAAEEDVITNSSGQAIAPAAIGNISTGGQVNYPYGLDGLQAPDPNTGRNYTRVIQATNGMIYGIKLSAASAAGTLALVGTTAALLLTTVGGITTFTVDTTKATTAVLQIVDVNTSDPLYGSVGCEVFCVVLPTYQQGLTNLVYTSN